MRARAEDQCCLNCDAPIGDNRYCGACGQENVRGAYSVKELVSNVFEEVFTLDSKALRSLRPLLTRPGALTVEHLHGRRARFVRPLRLYLLASLLFFLVTSITGNTSGLFQVGMNGEPPRSISPAEFAAFADSMRVANQAADGDSIESVRAADEWVPIESDDVKGVPVIGGLLVRKVERANAMGAQAFVETFNSSVRRYLPRALFVCVPFFAAVLHLLYVRRKRYYVEHLVFVLHNQAFLFLIMAITLLIPFDPLRLVGILVSVVYLVTAMRRVYEQGWGRSVVKSMLFMAGSTVILIIMIALASVVSVLSI